MYHTSISGEYLVFLFQITLYLWVSVSDNSANRELVLILQKISVTELYTEPVLSVIVTGCISGALVGNTTSKSSIIVT